MSRIEQLISELCPEGVERKELGEIGEFENIGVDKKILIDQSPVLLLNYMDIYRNKYITRNTITMKVTASTAKIEKCNILKGDIFITPTSETIEDIGHTSVAVEDIEGAVYSYHIMRFRQFNVNIITSFYINYIFDSEIVQKQILKSASGLTRFGLTKRKFAKISIPLPPLPIQQEIVRILDTFTDLDAELQAELDARKKQFNFYKEKLFNYSKDFVEWRPLGDVGKFQRGKRFVKNDIVSSGVPCIHYGELYTYYKTWTKETKSFIVAEKAGKLRFAKPGDVIIVSAGETIEDIGNAVAWLGDLDVVIHDACFSYSHNFNAKFVSYYFQTNLFRSQIKRHISSGKISAIHESGLSKAEIPIPPFTEQERIVSILDKFEALVNVELPAEIAARRKQYEYYREKLMTFEPLVS